MVRFLHAADLHLGMRITRFDEAACKRLAEARFEAIENLRAAAELHQVDFMIIAGDMFDENTVDRRIYERAFAIFEGAGVSCPVFIIPGNHDPLTPGSIWTRDPWQREQPTKHIRVLRESTPVALPDLSVTLFPCPLRAYKSLDDPTEWIVNHPRGADDRTIRIGIAHGGLRLGSKRLEEDDHLIREDAANYYGLDYLALGHWHTELRHKSADGSERIAYSGTHEPARFPGMGAAASTGWTSRTSNTESDLFDDGGVGTALLVSIDQPCAPPKIETVEIGRLRWKSEHYDLTSKPLGELISEYSQSEDRALTMLRLKLSGVIDPRGHSKINPGFSEIIAARYCPGSTLDADAVMIEPNSEQLNEVVGKGVLKSVLNRLLEERQSDDPTKKQIAEHALKVLYRIAWEAQPS